MEKTKVLFVCLGNICRSPTAEGVFRHLAQEAGLEEQFVIDSAGTSHWHIGEAPDMRTMEEAALRGIDISKQRSRQVQAKDFTAFDHILGMDPSNVEDMLQICPKNQRHKVQLFTKFAPELGVKGVPDPYYGGPKGFSRVFDIVEAASRGFLESLKQD